MLCTVGHDREREVKEQSTLWSAAEYKRGVGYRKSCPQKCPSWHTVSAGTVSIEATNIQAHECRTRRQATWQVPLPCRLSFSHEPRYWSPFACFIVPCPSRLRSCVGTLLYIRRPTDGRTDRENKLTCLHASRRYICHHLHNKKCLCIRFPRVRARIFCIVNHLMQTRR